MAEVLAPACLAKVLGKPMYTCAHETASVYLTLAGLGCRVRGKARLGGLVLLLAGIGFGGVQHERIARSRLSGYRHGEYHHFDPGQVLVHAALALYGYDLLTRP